MGFGCGFMVRVRVMFGIAFRVSVRVRVMFLVGVRVGVRFY